MEGDKVVFVELVREATTMFLATTQARILHFHVKDVPIFGGPRKGVRGIRLAPDDRVLGAALMTGPRDSLRVITTGDREQVFGQQKYEVAPAAEKVSAPSSGLASSRSCGHRSNSSTGPRWKGNPEGFQMPGEQYRVRVTKDHLVFSAAHFITYNGNICERLHGHNWRVAVEVAGPLDGTGTCSIFSSAAREAQQIVNELDHRMLLPLQHASIRVAESPAEVEVRFEGRRWVFPREDCILLPIENTTAERLAWWIGQRLRDVLNLQGMTSLQVDVEENFGQWATCEIPLPPG